MPYNRKEIFRLIKKCREFYPEKSIWLYTGSKWEEIWDLPDLNLIDVIAEGEFVEALKDNNLHWVGSSNQRVIDVKSMLEQNKIVLHA